MDREQEELQLLGFFGITKESFKIIFSWKKIFTQISLTVILPLSFIFLSQILVSHRIFSKILDNQEILDHSQYSYAISHRISSEWAIFWLFKLAYFTFLLVFALLSTAAVVYTVACVYSRKPVAFKKVISSVPRVWKRLMVTFLWSFFLVLIYNVISLVLLFLWVEYVLPSIVGAVFFFVFLAVYFVGLLYITIIWHMASVISVLEQVYGRKSLVKSKNLMKGKWVTAVAVFILLGVSFVGIQAMFEIFVVLGSFGSLGIRILIGIVCLLLLVKVILFGLVIQTVLYLVCKSYHHETIDRPTLSDHLEAYLGDYVPLKAANVQMERIEV